MRVLHVASELYPLVKTGGLGDVAAALPPALRALGADVRLLLPALPALRAGIVGRRPVAALGARFGAAAPTLARVRAPPSEVPVYLVEAPELYDRPGGPYGGPDGRDWPDNHRRFALLGWAAARFAEGDVDGWRPDIIHGHDWHAGLASAYLRARGGGGPASVFTIHNLAFQGLFPAAAFSELGLPAGFFAIDGLEFYGQVSFMKAGIVYADRLTTVSPTYAAEIQDPVQGCGLDGVLRTRRDALTGILNGIDPVVWNPARDPQLPAPYDAYDTAGKADAKRALQRAAELADAPDAPLCGIVSRLTGQKGIDLVLGALPALLEEGGQLALLGSGDTALEAALGRFARAHRRAVAVRLGYDEDYAHAVIGGADILLVPSRFEPCGLTQLYALRYGTVPVVRRVGGLADTVVDATDEALARGRATGIVFEDATADALAAALRRAAALYRDGSRWRRLMRQGMAQDFGWRTAAARYLTLYRELAAVAH